MYILILDSTIFSSSEANCAIFSYSLIACKPLDLNWQNLLRPEGQEFLTIVTFPAKGHYDCCIFKPVEYEMYIRGPVEGWWSYVDLSN